MKPVSFTRAVDDPDEPVSLDELKKQIKMEDLTVDDDYLTSLITVAREACEEQIKGALVPQTWQLGYRDWDYSARPQHVRVLDLIRPPINEVSLVEYQAPGSLTWIELDTSYWNADTGIWPGVVQLSRSSLPMLNLDVPAPVRITVEAGTWDPFPARIKQAILLLAANYYELRTSVITGTVSSQIPDHIGYLLDSFKCRNL